MFREKTPRVIHRLRFLTVLWVLLFPFFCGQVAADESESLEQLRDEFRVIELRHGWALQPRDENGDFRLIEIVSGEVTVDGQSVDEEELRRYVDEAADLIIDIARQDDQSAVDEDRVRRHRRRSDTQVSFATGLVVESDEVIDEIVLLSGSLDMRGEVEGDTTVIMGSAVIDGTIGGELVVIGGPIELKSDSRVHGDVVAVGGRVIRESGSVVDGELVQIAMGDLDLGDIGIDFGWPEDAWPDGGWGGPLLSGFDLVQAAIVAGMVWVVISCVYFVAPRRTGGIAERLRLEPWKSGLVGLVLLVMLLPVVLLLLGVLLISIVGIPLIFVLMPLLGLLLVLFYFLGLAGASLSLGERVSDRFGWRASSAYWLLLVGFGLIYLWTIIGEALLFTPWPIRLMAYLLLIAGWVIKFVSWTAGLGAAILQQFSPLDRRPPVDRWTGLPAESSSENPPAESL